ncbi:MAG: response regulator transcription factor [bacterium]|nr:response regulator transcription factor [bacterium]
MKNFDAIVVDDERLARKELQLLLSAFPNIRVVGEAGSIAEAVNLIEKHNPGIVFLDIQLTGESGFELLKKVELTFHLVFVTAFDEYAIRAFDVNAMDYLLKPVNPKRLKKTIDRLLENGSQTEEPAVKLEYKDTLFEKINDSLKLVKIEKIVCICAEGDYTRIVSCENPPVTGSSGTSGSPVKTNGYKDINGGTPTGILVTRSLKRWEELLPEKHFIRIHRSTIVNIEYVKKIEKWFHNAYRVYVGGVGEPFVMSRRYASKLKKHTVLMI